MKEAMRKLAKTEPVSFAVDLVDTVMTSGAPRTAAALSYFLLLTLFPLLVCVNWFISFFRVDLLQLLEEVQQMLPGGAVAVISDYLTYAAETQSSGLLVACVFTILVSASAGLRTVFNTLETMANVPHRNPLWMVVHSIVLSVILLLTIYLSFIVIFTGDWFFKFLLARLPEAVTAVVPLESLSELWHWLRYLMLFCFLMLLITGLYGAGIPGKVMKLRVKFCSSVLTSAALVGASAIFSAFVGYSSRYALVYGSLASIIVLLMWLYFCGNILLLGAAVACVWTRRHGNRKKEQA